MCNRAANLREFPTFSRIGLAFLPLFFTFFVATRSHRRWRVQCACAPRTMLVAGTIKLFVAARIEFQLHSCRCKIHLPNALNCCREESFLLISFSIAAHSTRDIPSTGDDNARRGNDNRHVRNAQMHALEMRHSRPWIRYAINSGRVREQGGDKVRRRATRFEYKSYSTVTTRRENKIHRKENEKRAKIALRPKANVKYRKRRYWPKHCECGDRILPTRSVTTQMN